MTPELRLRRQLAAAMVGSWVMTWHEDREVNPGVPDVSYVMVGGVYETGWLELKAQLDDSGPWKFKLEASQHKWIGNHLGKVPVHFLMATGDTFWLVPGERHKIFAKSVSKKDMLDISICSFTKAEMRAVLNGHLRALTHRRRYD